METKTKATGLPFLLPHGCVFVVAVSWHCRYHKYRKHMGATATIALPQIQGGDHNTWHEHFISAAYKWVLSWFQNNKWSLALLYPISSHDSGKANLYCCPAATELAVQNTVFESHLTPTALSHIFHSPRVYHFLCWPHGFAVRGVIYGQRHSIMDEEPSSFYDSFKIKHP